MLQSGRAKIILVEDDESLAEVIKEYLEEKDCDVQIVNDGGEAEGVILAAQPDLVILDLMLPNKDGISICKDLRPQYDGPVMMLTASSESVDQIVGLEIGADDYVQKPIEPRVLLARIKSLLRLYSKIEEASTDTKNNSDQMSFGNLSFIKTAHKITLGGQELTLTGPEYDILLHLAEHAGIVQSRDDLFKAIRGIEYDGKSRMIDIIVSQVRQKLAGDPDAEKRIKTIRNKGYLFVTEV